MDGIEAVRMKERTSMLVFVGLFLAWIFSSSNHDPVSTLPTDGLVEQVEAVKDSLTPEPIENLEDFDHIPDDSKKVEPKKEIVIFSIEGCKPCKDWVAIEQPKFQKAGWKVVKSDDPMTGPWPHFMIETNGKKIEYRSYLSFDKIDEVVK